MKRLLFLILILAPIILTAQKSNFEEGRSITTIKSTDGGKITLGSTTTLGEGPESYLVISKGKSKDQKWQKTFGGTSYDRAVDITSTSDNGNLLLGSTSSYGNGNYDVLLIKINAAGNQEWQKTFGEFHNEYAESIEAKEDDHFVVKARKQFCEVKNDFSTCVYGDIYIKIDSDGNQIWEKSAIDYSSK